MAKIILTRGIPGSGKSTAAVAWVAEAPESRMRLSRDDDRLSRFGRLSGLTDAQEAIITRLHLDAARLALAKGFDVIVDATNLSSFMVKPWFKVGPVEFWDFPCSVEWAIENDAKREKQVGEKVIRKFAKRVNKDGSLKPPPQPPQPVVEFKPYVPDTDLPTAFVFDIDGTLARMTGRNPYDYTRVSEDAVVEHVKSMLLWVADRHQIIVLSGREDSCLADTVQWLNRHGIVFDRLYMRAHGDKRDDAIVKHEFFHEKIAPRFNVLGIFDDRLRVVRMWHAIGAPVFRVGDPDAAF